MYVCVCTNARELPSMDTHIFLKKLSKSIHFIIYMYNYAYILFTQRGHLSNEDIFNDVLIACCGKAQL